MRALIHILAPMAILLVAAVASAQSVSTNTWNTPGGSSAKKLVDNGTTLHYDFTSAANSAIIHVRVSSAIVCFDDNALSASLSGSAIQLRVVSDGTDGTGSDLVSIAPAELALSDSDCAIIRKGWYYVDVTTYGSGTGRVFVTGGVQ